MGLFKLGNLALVLKGKSKRNSSGASGGGTKEGKAGLSGPAPEASSRVAGKTNAPRRRSRSGSRPKPTLRAQQPKPQGNQGKPQDDGRVSFFGAFGTFSDLGLSPEILSLLRRKGFSSPSEIQSKSIPLILKGGNVICSSQTGSGKTFAFGLPIIEKLRKKQLTQALVLAPTREIAIQINSVLSDYCGAFGIRSALLIGGVDIAEQKKALRDYPSILIATPGRLLDILNTGMLWLKYTGMVVLDEADRMIDMGFERDLKRIYEEFSGEQQNLCFTATLVPGFERLIKQYVPSAERVIVGERMAAGDNIRHYMVPMNRNQKRRALEMLFSLESKSVIVFFNTIRETTHCYSFMRRRHRNAELLHSGKSQEERFEVLRRMRKERSKWLFATDLAARGLDVPKVSLVVNYDIPTQPEDYVHRIGRTGRAGKIGRACSFCTPEDAKYKEAIEHILKKKIEVVGSVRSLWS